MTPSSSSTSTSTSYSPQPSKTQIPATCSPSLKEKMLNSKCYTCQQKGHWSWFCPSKSTNSKPTSASPKNNDSAGSSDIMIQCRCGHGSCIIKTTRYGKEFYACPIKRGQRCDEPVKWCNEPINESDLKPPPLKYPVCKCSAGVCKRVKGTESHDAFKYFFICPIKKGQGSCGYRVSEDELFNNNSKRDVPIRQSRQRAHADFWEGCRNDEIDDELGNELVKKMRITDSSEIRDGFPDVEFEEDDDDIEIKITNSVSWNTIEAEAFVLVSQLSSPSRIRWRQMIFQSYIFSDTSFGAWPMGWLGRLLFFYPSQSLKFPTPKPFFCCVFPSFNPITVPKQTSIIDGAHECNQLAAINNVGQHTQLSTGCHTEVSTSRHKKASLDIVSPGKSQDGERKSIMSKAQRHREVVLFTQQRLLIDLETLDPHEHESMREAAETTFGLLNNLGVDYNQFSDFVLDYINIVSSISELDQSMENSLTMEDHHKLFEEEKMRLAQLQDDYVKTKAWLEASNRHKQLLCEQVSNLKSMLNEKQNQLKSCELETLNIETQIGDLKRNIVKAEITLKERAEQTEVARKQSEERRAKQIAAKEALQKAKLELEN